jgi:hypothetical protein
MIWGNNRTLVLKLSRGRCREGTVYHRERGEHREKNRQRVAGLKRGGVVKQSRSAQQCALRAIPAEAGIMVPSFIPLP